MNKGFENISKAVKNISKLTKDEEIHENLAQISRTTRILKNDWFNISSLIEANKKLVDNKRFILADMMILIKYINGEEELSYQVKNIIKNYNKGA